MPRWTRFQGQNPPRKTGSSPPVDMVEIQPIRVELEREEDGRILASVPDLPGVMAYAASEEEAVRRVQSIALQVLADMITSGEDVADR